MENIVRISKKVLAVIVLVFISIQSQSQDYKPIQSAFEISYKYEYNGEYSKAIDALKKVYDQSSYEINLRLGWMTYLSGLFVESTAYYQKAIELKPIAIEAKLGYVYPASAIGNWEQVKKQYDDILKIDPQNTTANYRLGSIYYGNENYSTALKHFEKIVNLYPFDYDSVLMFAWTNLKLGKTREATVLFNKALMIQPSSQSAVEGLSLIK